MNHWLSLIAPPKMIIPVKIVKVRIRGACISQEEVTARYTKAANELMMDGNQYAVKQLTMTLKCGANWARRWLTVNCEKHIGNNPARFSLRKDSK